MDFFRQALAVIAGSLILIPAQAAMPAPAAVKAPVLAPAAGELQGDKPQSEAAPTAMSLERLGLGYSMHLRGVDATQSVTFDVRKDQVVTGLELDLKYSYSPALIEQLSHLKILLNDQVAFTQPLPKANAGSAQQSKVMIPAYLASEFNRLAIQFIGHYTLECEDPLHSSLWARVSNQSTLRVNTEPLLMPNDLAALPEPFFDRRDASTLTLPFVLPNAPSAEVLEAGATIASWFGALASYRGANFPVSFDQLPAKGNAVVLMVDATDEAAELEGRTGSARIQVLTHPQDPYGKLLVVSGSSAGALKQAALALVSAAGTFKGESAQVQEVVQFAPRKPYDAPNWLPLDRAVQLGELLDVEQLTVEGYDPGTISLPMRLPPSLFHWRQKGAKLNLIYRYTPTARGEDSSLLVSMGGTYIRSLPLPSYATLNEPSLLSRLNRTEQQTQQTTLYVPLDTLGSFTALELRYLYKYQKEGQCRDALVHNMRGSIDPESTIDLRGYEHFVAMPNLNVFQSSGFPFTRMADLAESAVIIPAQPSAALIQALLDVVGHFGASTGLPASALTVGYEAELERFADKDLLILTDQAQSAVLEAWAEYLPASLTPESRFSLSDLTYQVRRWLSDEPAIDRRPARQVVSVSEGGVGHFIAGFESPLTARRSVVVLAAQNSEGLSQLTAALTRADEYEEPLQGSLVVVNGGRIQALVADETYYVGTLGWWRYSQWLMTQHLWLMLLLTFVVVLLVAKLLQVSLRARARQRLNREA